MVKVVDAAWLAQRVGDYPNGVLLLDTREVAEYNRGFINTSIHICCEGMILRRLKKGTLKIESLLNHEEDKGKYEEAKSSERISIVVCDQSSFNTESLPSDSMASLLLKKVSRECKHVAFLEGGFELFRRLHAELCDLPEDSHSGSQKRPSSLVLQLNSLSLSTMGNANDTVESPMDFTSSEEDTPDVIPPFQILPHLYLGCRKVATCLPGLKQCNVTKILNVTSTIPNHFQNIAGFTYKQIAVEDNLDVDMTQHLTGAFQFIEEARQNGERVLVHCHAGRSRSVTIILAYLMKYYNHTLHSALEYVKERKPDVNPNLSFVGQLLNYEECNSGASPADSGLGSSPIESHYFIHSTVDTSVQRPCVLAI